jgi:hypothetical protein
VVDANSWIVSCASVACRIAVNSSEGSSARRGRVPALAPVSALLAAEEHGAVLSEGQVIWNSVLLLPKLPNRGLKALPVQLRTEAIR